MKMKHLILVFSLGLAGMWAYGQNAFYDALKVYHVIHEYSLDTLKKQTDAYVEILSTLKAKLDEKDSLEYLDNNQLGPFIKIDSVNWMSWRTGEIFDAAALKKSGIENLKGRTVNKGQLLKLIEQGEEHASMSLILQRFQNNPYEGLPTETVRISEFLKDIMSVTATGEVEISKEKLDAYLTIGELELSSNRVSRDEALADKATASTVFSWESALIDGTAKFIGERFKEEVTRLYINKFRTRLDSVTYFDKLLPKTFDFLNEADVFNYQELGNDFKDAFEQDLENTLTNLRDLIETEKDIHEKLDTNLRNAFVFSLDLAEKLINEYHPVEILDYLEQEYDFKTKGDKSYQGYYDLSKGLNILQYNLQRRKPSEDDDEIPIGEEGDYKDIWLPYELIKKMNTPEEVIYFSAFLYHQDTSFFKRLFDPILKEYNASIENFNMTKEEVEKQDASKKDELDEDTVNKIGANLYEGLISPIITLLNDIEKIQVKDQLNGDDYVGIIENFVGILEVLESLGIDWGNDFILFSKDGEDLLEKIIDVYRSIYRKDYAYLVSSGSYVIAALLEDALTQSKDTSKVNFIQLLQAYKKYSSFMVDIVTADNSDDVKEAIKRHVTKFSFLDKRRSRVSITVSAHPGIVAGLEQLSGTTNFKWNVGITAPIGFEFAWGHKDKEELILANSKLSRYEFVDGNQLTSFKGSYTSLMLSIVDIGAVFNYRLTNSDSALPHDITLKQVFSPGISIQHGFKNSPLTLGFGVQYTPELREITSEGNTDIENSLRLQARLTWDIPLMKLLARRWKQKP